LDSAGAVDPQFYYFPFDGSPLPPVTTTGILDLYYIEVWSEDNVLQDTREAWPNSFVSIEESEVKQNYVSNGQFRLHNDIPAKPDAAPPTVAGEITKLITDVAPGGWTYERGINTGKELVTFDRFGSFTTNPEKSPRYAIKLDVQDPGTGTFRGLRLKYKDVNKFASDTDEFTLTFTSKSSIDSTLFIDVVKNFGTGGSPETTNNLGMVGHVGGIYSKNSFTFTFGDNDSKIIGVNDDDFIQIVFRLPSDVEVEVSITDVILAEGKLQDPVYPYETDRQMIQSALGGGFPVPKFDGSNLLLPPILTKDGWQYDDSAVGMRFACTTDAIPAGHFLADGSKYVASDCSSEGVPYSRLQKKWFARKKINKLSCSKKNPQI